MTAIVISAKRRWSAAACGALLVALLLLLLFRVPNVTPMATNAPASSRPSVKLASRDRIDAALTEEAMMKDLAPLFLPTEWNAVRREPPRREPGRTFLENQPLKLSYGDAELSFGKELPPVVTLEGKPLAEARPADALRSNSPSTMMLSFGRNETRVPVLPPRGGFVEIVSAATGRKVWGMALPLTAAPATDKPWEPLEFFAAVDAAGLVAPLTLTEGSRVEEVDQHFRNYLSQTFRIGDRLAPGFYRVIVGP
jgi:hypothetical protein